MGGVLRGIILSFSLSLGLLASPVFAQDDAKESTRSELTINDIAGRWRIEVIDRPNSTFKGTANIPRAEGQTVLAETITEDKCCGEKNHARVLQDSQIAIDTDGNITVNSTIIKYLLREEEIKMGYSADDFELRQLDADTLIGTANGYKRVRWVRDVFNMS